MHIRYNAAVPRHVREIIVSGYVPYYMQNTHVKIRIFANIHITYVLGTFLIALCLRKIMTKVPFPRTPTTNIAKNNTGTIYVSGLWAYGVYASSGSMAFSSKKSFVRLLLLNSISGKKLKMRTSLQKI